MASLFSAVWAFFVHRFAEPAARPMALGLGVMNYPLLFLLERGNIFAGIVAVCLLIMLCRRKLDWTAVLLLAPPPISGPTW